MTLALQNVSVGYGNTRILEQVDARFDCGQIVGLIGPNGTGKSTLIKAIATLLPFTGSIRWHQAPVDIRRIGFMPQHCQVRAELSVLEAVLLGHHEHLGLRVGSERIDRAIRILDDFGIAHLHDRSMTRLSGGQQQLVLLAQRLLREPTLLLLDEATSALDIRHQMQVFERLTAYVQRTGALVVIAIHDLNLAARHAQTVLLLNHGRVFGQGRFDEVVSCDSLRRVYGIESEIITTARRHTAVIPVCPCTDASSPESTPASVPLR